MQTANRKKKILYIDDGEAAGGSLVSLMLLMSHLSVDNYATTVILRSNQPYINLYKKYGLNVITFPGNVDKIDKSIVNLKRQVHTRVNKYILLTKFYKSISKFKNLIICGIPEIVKYIFLIRRNKYNVIHCNNSIILNINMILASILMRTKCVVHVRRIEQMNYFETAIARRVASIICISDYVKEVVVAQLGEKGRVIRVYNATNCTNDEMKADNVKEYDIIALGRIINWKGYEYLIKAIYELAKQNYFPEVLILGDGPDKRRLINLVDKYGLTNLKFADHTFDPESYLGKARILVHTAVCPEPFGRVIIEAMRAYLPVLATNIGACPELVQDGITGFLLEPANIELLASKLINLLDDEKLRHSMGIAGNMRVRKEFTIENQVALIENEYKS